MTSQEFYDTYMEKSKQIKELQNEVEELKESYKASHGLDNDYEIIINDYLQYIRLFKATSQCVNNVKYDIGILSSPKT